MPYASFAKSRVRLVSSLRPPGRTLEECIGAVTKLAGDEPSAR